MRPSAGKGAAQKGERRPVTREPCKRQEVALALFTDVASVDEGLICPSLTYLLGRSGGEEGASAADRRSSAVFTTPSENIGIKPGERVVDIGCGPGGVPHLLGKRVGPTGSALGIDRSAHFVDSARHFAADLGLKQVEVRVLLVTTPDCLLDPLTARICALSW